MEKGETEHLPDILVRFQRFVQCLFYQRCTKIIQLLRELEHGGEEGYNFKFDGQSGKARTMFLNINQILYIVKVLTGSVHLRLSTPSHIGT